MRDAESKVLMSESIVCARSQHDILMLYALGGWLTNDLDLVEPWPAPLTEVWSRLGNQGRLNQVSANA